MTKKGMIKFITSFEKYPTMNSWNGAYGYSINAKIHSLPLQSHEKERLYEIVGDENLSREFYDVLSMYIQDWRYNNMDLFGQVLIENRTQPRFDAAFNGRSGGHLVLYKWNGHNWSGTGWSHDEDELKEMSKEDVRYIYQVLKSFDRLFKDMVKMARTYAGTEIEDATYTVTKTRKRFKNIA